MDFQPGLLFWTFFPFALVGALLLVPRLLRYRERAQLHQTLRYLAEKGQPIPSDLLLAVQGKSAASADLSQSRREDASSRDVRVGVISLMVAAGFIVSGAAEGDVVGSFGFASFPLFIGVGYLLLGFWSRGRRS